MPLPFLPSQLAVNLAKVIDRGQPSQPVGELVFAGQRKPAIRNPMYQSTVEHNESKAYFMTQGKRIEKDYAVLPGGRTVYTENHRPLVPIGSNDIHVGLGSEAQPITDGYKVKRPPRTSAMLAFPEKVFTPVTTWSKLRNK